MSNWALHSDTTPESTRPAIPDTPIDFSIPYRSRERGASRHFGFMPFFAKKPWPVVQEYIKHYSRPGTLVGDPFVGSGVTAVEALVLGRRVVVSDINPVAAFITRTTAVSPVDLEALQRAYDQVQDEAQSPIEELTQLSPLEISGLLAHLRFPHDPIPSTVRRGGLDTLDQLHTPRQLAALAILRDAIAKIVDPIARDL